MRLDLAWPPSAAERLDPLKDQNRYESRQGAGKESTVAVLSPAYEYENAERIPQPAIAQAAHDQHENAYRPRRAPAVQAAHQAKIALFDIAQEGPGYGHAQTSAGRVARYSLESACGRWDLLTRALQRRANSASSRDIASTTAGTRTAMGLNTRVQGRS